jgi:hypothetical protein
LIGQNVKKIAGRKRQIMQQAEGTRQENPVKNYPWGEIDENTQHSAPV